MVTYGEFLLYFWSFNNKKKKYKNLKTKISEQCWHISIKQKFISYT